MRQAVRHGVPAPKRAILVGMLVVGPTFVTACGGQHPAPKAVAQVGPAAPVAVVHVAAQGNAGARAIAAAAAAAGAGRRIVVYRQADPARARELGRLTVAGLRDGRPQAGHTVPMTCSRVAFAAGHGVCLDVLDTNTTVALLDSRLRQVAVLVLAGIPSRVRISPDGRLAGVTTAELGHTYTGPGPVSTHTTIIDLDRKTVVADLTRDVQVNIGGRVLRAADRSFWGLTFASDGDTYYATAGSGGRTWLIQGSIRAGRAHAIHANVESPALSPDETRIAYEHAVAQNPTRWRLHVLDLATGRDWGLAERRSIDDQPAWLDDRHVLYADARGVTWVADADGGGRPRRWLDHGTSATVSRAG